MATDVSICNLALAHLVQTPNIVSLDPPDGGAYAKSAKQFFNYVINSCLRHADWNFARKRKNLTQVDLGTEQPASWEYAFQVPTDMIQPRFLIETGDTDDNKLGYLIEGQYIYSNAEESTLIYTKKLTDMTQISVSFESAASMLMASFLTGSVSPGNIKLKDYWYKMYQQELSTASAENNNRGINTWNSDPEWTTDR